MLATLIRHLGGDFQLAEDALQDAFLAAVVAWPRDGAPTVPAAWLTTTARRKAIDRLRRARSADERVHSLEALTGLEVTDPPPLEEEPSAVDDDRLRLLFTCCHPALPLPSRVALTVKSLGRAQHGADRPRVPGDQGRHGPAARSRQAEDRPGRHPREAIRLSRLLAHLMPEDPETHGLLALMLLTDARRAARTGPGGDPIDPPRACACSTSWAPSPRWTGTSHCTPPGRSCWSGPATRSRPTRRTGAPSRRARTPPSERI